MANSHPVEIDIIILSYAHNEELKSITQNGIDSLVSSQDPGQIKFNIVVIESQKSLKPYQYPNSKTIYPWQSFGYHKYMNIGIRRTKSRYICICNNDLLFYPNWATEILKAFQKDDTLYSACPACTIHHPEQGIQLDSGIYYGTEVRKELVGWCIFFRREMLKITGKLDPGFKFWYADNDYGKTLEKYKLKHALITSSHVEHLESRTLKTKGEMEQKKLTAGEKFYYEYKWEGRGFFSYLNKVRKFNKNLRRGRI